MRLITQDGPIDVRIGNKSQDNLPKTDFVQIAAQLKLSGLAEKPKRQPVIGVSSVGKGKIGAFTARHTIDEFVPRHSPDAVDSDITDYIAVILDNHFNDSMHCERLHS